eukprot:SAG31_NODE_12946_length_905_cov_0.998759_1_plen_93_part_10
MVTVFNATLSAARCIAADPNSNVDCTLDAAGIGCSSEDSNFERATMTYDFGSTQTIESVTVSQPAASLTYTALTDLTFEWSEDGTTWNTADRR